MRLRSPGGSASSTGRIRKAKIGRAKTSPAAPSTSTAITERSSRERSSPRCSERLIRAWGAVPPQPCALGSPSVADGWSGASPLAAVATAGGIEATTPSGGGKTEG